MEANELNALITSGEKESLTLEFKKEPYKRSDKNELLKDVTAMANAEGGHIIIGVEEENSRAKEIFKLEDSVVESSITRFQDWCTDFIEPRLQNLIIYKVKIDQQPLIVISIPRRVNVGYSYEADNKPVFKIRVNDRIRDMHYYEIAACMAYKTYESDKKSETSTLATSKSPIDDFNNARLNPETNKLDFDILKFEKEISNRGPSEVYLYSCQNQEYVVKRTKNKICDYTALKKLIGLRPSGKAWKLESKIAIPLAVRSVESYVFELHPYYKGISLYDLALKNEDKLRGDYLGALFNSLVIALNCIHEKGLIHRDVRPQNMFLLEDGNICLLDCSFVCKLGARVPPIDIGAFTAPEQNNGNPTKKSDWYSLAVSIYFLFYKNYPSENFASSEYEYPLEENKAIELGAFYNRYDCSPLSALSPDPEKRPGDLYSVLLAEHSRAVFNDCIISILNADKLGILILKRNGFLVAPKTEEPKYRRQKEEGFRDFFEWW